MSDAHLLELVLSLPERPRLTIGNQSFIHVDGAVVLLERVGTGERWRFSPGRGLKPITALPSWWPREARAWALRAETLDLAGHARAMSARTL